MKQKEFLSWLREIEIKNLNNKDDFKYIDFNFKEQFLNKKEPLDKDDLEKLEIDSEIKKEYVEELNTILSFFSDKNMYFNKVWKYKILYFLYGYYINAKTRLKEKLLINSFNDSKLLDFTFFADEEKVKWLAYQNGPITNHYKYGSKDKEIIIDFNKINNYFRDLLESSYFYLKIGTLDILIEESHKTAPWLSKKYLLEKQIKNIEIKKEEIIDYFKKNKPFFIE